MKKTNRPQSFKGWIMLSTGSERNSGSRNTYPLDSDLSSGKRYPTFEQPEPGLHKQNAEHHRAHNHWTKT